METRTALWLESISASVRATADNLQHRNAPPGHSHFAESHQTRVDSLTLGVHSLRTTITRQLEESFKPSAYALQTCAARVILREEKAESSSFDISTDGNFSDLQIADSWEISKFAKKQELKSAFDQLRTEFQEDKKQLEAHIHLSAQQGLALPEELRKLEEIRASAPAKAAREVVARDVSTFVSERTAKAGFSQCVTSITVDTLSQITKKTRATHDELSQQLRESKRRVHERIDTLAAEAAALRLQITAERSQLSLSAAEDSLTGVQFDTVSRALKRLVGKVETRQKQGKWRDLEARVERAERELRERQARKARLSRRVQSLQDKVEELQGRQELITDDSNVSLSIGEVQPSALDTNSDFMVISIHDMGDSDLESQGYISPHLSPMNALFHSFQPTSPKTTSLVKVDVFTRQVADSLISSETDVAFRLFEQAIYDQGAKPPTGPVSLMGRSTLQYSEDNGETLEDEIADLSDLEPEPGETVFAFLED